MKELKKIVSILMATLVLISATGITVYSHQCTISGKQKLSIHSTSSCCGKMNMPKGCCKDEAKVFKANITATPSSEVQKNISGDFILTIPFYKHYLLGEFTGGFSSHLTYQPPSIPIDINMLVECFRI